MSGNFERFVLSLLHGGNIGLAQHQLLVSVLTFPLRVKTTCRETAHVEAKREKFSGSLVAWWKNKRNHDFNISLRGKLIRGLMAQRVDLVLMFLDGKQKHKQISRILLLKINCVFM